MKVVTPEGYTFVTKFQEDNSHKVLRSVDFFSIKFDEIFFDTVCWVPPSFILSPISLRSFPCLPPRFSHHSLSFPSTLSPLTPPLTPPLSPTLSSLLSSPLSSLSLPLFLSLFTFLFISFCLFSLSLYHLLFCSHLSPLFSLTVPFFRALQYFHIVTGSVAI